MSFIFAGIGLGASSRVYIKSSDWILFVVTLLAIPVWYLTANPLWAVVIITIIDAMAFIPTFRKAFHHPQTENATTYLLSGIKFVFGIAALEMLTLTTVLYPASLVLANIAFVGMLLWRNSRAKVI